MGATAAFRPMVDPAFGVTAGEADERKTILLRATANDHACAVQGVTVLQRRGAEQAPHPARGRPLLLLPARPHVLTLHLAAETTTYFFDGRNGASVPRRRTRSTPTHPALRDPARVLRCAARIGELHLDPRRRGERVVVVVVRLHRRRARPLFCCI